MFCIVKARGPIKCLMCGYEGKYENAQNTRKNKLTKCAHAEQNFIRSNFYIEKSRLPHFLCKHVHLNRSHYTSLNFLVCFFLSRAKQLSFFHYHIEWLYVNVMQFIRE